MIFFTKYHNLSIFKSSCNIQFLLHQQTMNNESFQSSMKNTLSVAYALGLFPIKGLRENQAIALSYNKLSVPSFLSLFTILTLLWAAILSLVHTVRSLLRVNSGKSGIHNTLEYIKNNIIRNI